MTRWRPNNRITYSKWQECDRCGLPWPLKVLRRQRGILLCPECWDEPSHEDYVKERSDELRDPEKLSQEEPGE